jgi:hypothetical protein
MLCDGQLWNSGIEDTNWKLVRFSSMMRSPIDDLKPCLVSASSVERCIATQLAVLG